MPISLVTGPANAGKARVVLEAVGAHAAHGEEPLLVVPTGADQARYRRELADGGQRTGVRVERFEGLLNEAIARSGSADVPLGTLAREQVLARLSGARPGAVAEIARFVGQLETQRVTPARLRQALAKQAGAGELARLARVFEEYQRTLARMRRADRDLLATRALDALRRQPALWRSTPVLLYGFDDLTELQLDTIETLGGVVGARVTVSLAYEPGRTVFAGRAGAFQRLLPLAERSLSLQARSEHYAPASRAALHHLERTLLSEAPAERVTPGGAVRLLEGGSPRAELELVAGEIRASIDRGVPPSEIAIVHRAPQSIAALLGEVLDDFAIAHDSRPQPVFARTALGRGLLGLLRCALDDGQLGDLLAWLRVPGALERPELADRLEASARRTGALSAAQARALWEAEHWPLERIDRLREASARGGTVLLDALLGELQRLFIAPRARLAPVLDADERYEARALAGGRRALEELRDLARLAPELAPGGAEAVETLERLELDSEERSTGEAVAVLDPLSLRARRVRIVFACGMQEGVFPAPPTPHPLLAEEQRRALAQDSGLVLKGEPDALAAERYLLYALVSRPEERLTLSWHSADEDGRPLARSLFVDDVCELFEESLADRVARRFAGAAHWPGPGRPAGAMASRPTEPLNAIEGESVTPIAPFADGVVLERQRERTLWSASGLETYARCPVKWLVERLLRAQEIDPDPEPLARGGLAHAALKDTLEGLLASSGSARITPASLPLARRLLLEALDRHAVEFPLSVAPERLPGARRRLQVELERYLRHAAEQGSPLEPAHLELEFGFADEQSESLPPLELGGGVELRGRIDRVDLGPQGEAVVYDYKGRSAPAGTKWAADGAFQMALYMRAVQRLLGHDPAGGFYQPLAGKDLRARGALDLDSGLQLETVRTDRLEHERFEELIEQCVQTARDAAAQARAGVLSPRPDTCAFRGGCSYPTICRCER